MSLLKVHDNDLKDRIHEAMNIGLSMTEFTYKLRAEGLGAGEPRVRRMWLRMEEERESERFEHTRGGAKFSEDGRYRYALSRAWGDGFRVTWIMLNPSTADHRVNDATIRRVVQFTNDWGYDGLYVVNLFGYRSRDPKALLAAPDPVGVDNDKWVKWAVLKTSMTVVAWGAKAKLFPRRVESVLSLIDPKRDIHCLGTSRDGFPLHPLMLPANTKLERYR